MAGVPDLEEEEEAVIELSLGLSIGGSYRKNPPVSISAPDRPSSVRFLTVDRTGSDGGEADLADPQRRKREEKKSLCRSGVSVNSHDRLVMEAQGLRCRARDRTAREADTCRSDRRKSPEDPGETLGFTTPNQTLYPIQNPNPNFGGYQVPGFSVMPPMSVPAHFPFHPMQCMPVPNGFHYPYLIPCWDPAPEEVSPASAGREGCLNPARQSFLQFSARSNDRNAGRPGGGGVGGGVFNRSPGSSLSAVSDNGSAGLMQDVTQWRQAAAWAGCRRNNEWLKAVRSYGGHSGRAAWSLLSYERKYNTYTRKRELMPPPTGVELCKASGVEASMSNSEHTDLLQVVEAYSSPSIQEEGMERQKPALKTKDLIARFVGARGSFSSVPISTPAESGAPGSTSPSTAAPPDSRVRQSSAAPSREVSLPENRQRPEGARQASREQASKEKAPSEKRQRTDGQEERGPETSSTHRPSVSDVWRPRLELEPGKPLNVEDSLEGNPLVIAALSQACALPRDMERHWRADDASLLIASLQSSILNVQMVQVVLDRNQQNALRLSQLESEKKELEGILAGVRERLKAVDETNASLIVEIDVAMTTISRITAEGHALRRAAEAKAKRALQLEAELVKKKADLEAVLKEKAELHAQSEVYFQDGVDEATKVYEAQVEKIAPILFELGCRAVLKKMGIADDHPIYQDLPRYSEEFGSSSAPIADVPSEAAAFTPSSEVPPATGVVEIPSSLVETLPRPAAETEEEILAEGTEFATAADLAGATNPKSS